MVDLRLITQDHIGLRTFYKSFQAYQKGNAGINNSALTSLMVDGKTKLHIHKTAQIINNGYFTLGIRPHDFFPSKVPSQLIMAQNSKLIINGSSRMGRGVILAIDSDATLELGKNVVVNSNTTIFCSKNVTIGDNTSISWDVEIMDTDFHRMTRADAVTAAPITIGEHVLVGRRALLLKGTTIGDGAVVAAGAVVTRNVPPHCMVAGVPAKIIKHDINWE